MRKAMMIFAILTASPVVAQEQEPDGPDIVVTGRKPLRIDAKILRAAQERFTIDRPGYAPQGVLRFELWRGTTRLPAGELGLALIDRGGRQVPVTVDGDGRFAFDKIPVGRWWLTTPKPVRGMRLRPIILSSGTSIVDRRLGDLRAQCRVAVSMIRADASLLTLPMIGAFDAIGGCASKRFGFYHIVEQPLSGAVASGAGITRSLRISPKGTSYEAPLSDRTLTNDARVRLAYR